MNTRDSYVFIRWMSSFDELTEAQEGLLKSLKRSVRERNKASHERIIIKDEGIDGYVELFPLPDSIRSVDEAKAYFRKEEYIEFVPGPYDCSGRKFTRWFKVFERHGRYYAYHGVGYDV